MVKDLRRWSPSLASRIRTQLTRLYYSANFRYMQSLTMLAFIYLIMVVLLTRLVRWTESRLQRAYQR
ncbi:MAG: hypothetical protein R2867_13355 [Caldilineaceae bacterium]